MFQTLLSFCILLESIFVTFLHFPPKVNCDREENTQESQFYVSVLLKSINIAFK